MNIEKIIIGSLLVDHTRFQEAMSFGVSRELFNDQFIQKIWIAFEELTAEKVIPNLDAISLKVPQDEVYKLVDLLSEGIIGQNFEYYCRQFTTLKIMKDLALEISHLAKTIIGLGYADSLEVVISKASEILTKLRDVDSIDRDRTRFMPELIDSTISRLEQRIIDHRDGKPRGISTGIKTLDEMTAGLIEGRFYIIAARVSVGKTTFAAFMALQAMTQGKKILIFSNEMDGEDLIEKFLSRRSRIDSVAFQTGNLSEVALTRLIATAGELARFRGGINERKGWSLSQLEGECHKLKRQGELDLVFIDYTQQVKNGEDKSSYERVSETATALKKLSRDLKIPVIGLAQINREMERGGKSIMPGLAHLKDSGSLEQDADVVMILHKASLDESATILNVAKNRHGPTGAINLRHYMSTNDYEEC